MKLLPRFIKDFLPRTLMGRSLLILVTPLFVVQVITVYIFFDRHWQKMGDRQAFSIAGEIGYIADQMDEAGVTEVPQRLSALMGENLELATDFKAGETLRDVLRKNHDPFQSREDFITQTLAHALVAQVDRPFFVSVDRDEKWVTVQVQLKKGVLVVALPERRIFSSSGYIVLLWMAGSSVILLVIAVFFMRNQVRPIRRLAIAAERFGKGRDVPFFKVEGAREVRQAARAFIDMKDRLRRQIQQRTAMLAGVSHDLRTPLTRMKLQLELMGDTPDTKDLKTDIADMERMIEAYLQFARGEAGEEPVRTSLNDLIFRVAHGASREGEEVYFEAKQDVSLLLRPVAFERCLTNLVTNALKYGHHAWIDVRKVGEMIEITVDDDGPGIPETLYEDVFKPFYRGESSRNSKTGGVGLGLPIAQDIVLAHGGQIWLDKSPKGGLRVLVDLPV